MEQGPSLALQVAARNLQLDVASGEVIAALGSLGIRSILLKGSAIAQWLYDPASKRAYTDCDLLIDPSTFDQASACMTSLDFEQELEEVRPEGLPPKTQDWVRQRDGVVVELHRYLVGVKASPQLAFDEFVRDSVDIDLRGRAVPVLGLPARTLHLALHAAQHGRELRKALDDLERGIERLPIDLWRQAAELASRLQATEALVAGLELVEGGQRLVGELELPRHLSREVALRASTPDTFSLGLEWLSQAKGVRAKGLYLLRKIFPSRAFIRAQSGDADASRLRLGFLYVLRWISLVRRAPRGFATWFSAWARSRRP